MKLKALLGGVLSASLIALFWATNSLMDARQSLGAAMEECNTRVAESVAASEKVQREALGNALRRQIEALEAERLMDQLMREELQRRLEDKERELRVAGEELRDAARVSDDVCLDANVPRNVWVRVFPPGKAD